MSSDANRRRNLVPGAELQSSGGDCGFSGRVILDGVREALPLISSEGLSREAYAKFDTALLKTAWAGERLF